MNVFIAVLARKNYKYEIFIALTFIGHQTNKMQIFPDYANLNEYVKSN